MTHTTSKSLAEKARSFGRNCSFFAQGIRSIVLVIMSIFALIMALLKVITDTKEQRKERFKAIGVQFFFNLAPTILFLGAIAVFFVFNPFEALNKWSPIKTLSNHNPLSDPHSVLAKVLVPIIIFLIIAILMSTCRYIINTSGFCERNNAIRPLDVTHLFLDIDSSDVCNNEDYGISMRYASCDASREGPYQSEISSNTSFAPYSFCERNQRWSYISNLIISIVIMPIKLVLGFLRLIVSIVNLIESPLTVPIHAKFHDFNRKKKKKCEIAGKEFNSLLCETFLNSGFLIAQVTDCKSHAEKYFLLDHN